MNPTPFCVPPPESSFGKAHIGSSFGIRSDILLGLTSSCSENRPFNLSLPSEWRSPAMRREFKRRTKSVLSRETLFRPVTTSTGMPLETRDFGRRKTPEKAYKSILLRPFTLSKIRQFRWLGSEAFPAGVRHMPKKAFSLRKMPFSFIVFMNEIRGVSCSQKDSKKCLAVASSSARKTLEPPRRTTTRRASPILCTQRP